MEEVAPGCEGKRWVRVRRRDWAGYLARAFVGPDFRRLITFDLDHFRKMDEADFFKFAEDAILERDDEVERKNELTGHVKRCEVRDSQSTTGSSSHVTT